MAYFGESLMGITSQWFIDQDTSNWHTWDNLAWCFTQEFEYKIGIVPNRKTIKNFMNMLLGGWSKMLGLSLQWKSEIIDVFLQVQEPDHFHYLLSVVGKTFTLHTLSMSCPEPIPKAELALEDRCWPRSDPWPDLLSGRLKHERYNYSHDFSPR